MDTQKVMGVMFDRLYTLRNQLLHGGANWNSSVNHSQISQGVEIMEKHPSNFTLKLKIWPYMSLISSLPGHSSKAEISADTVISQPNIVFCVLESRIRYGHGS